MSRLPELDVLGSGLRRARVERGVTQERLAELADLNIRTLQKIEAGQINILITTVLRLQRALRCRWHELLPSEDAGLTERKTGAVAGSKRHQAKG